MHESLWGFAITNSNGDARREFATGEIELVR
jgi:hypothetical protein